MPDNNCKVIDSAINLRNQYYCRYNKFPTEICLG